MSTNADNVAMVERIYEVFGRRDYEAVLSHFTQDFEWNAADNSPLADRSPYRGVDAVRTGVFARIDAGFDRLVVKVDELFGADGGRVVGIGYYRGRFRGRPDEFRTQVAHIWTFHDGRATKFRQYMDTLKVARDADG